MAEAEFVQKSRSNRTLLLVRFVSPIKVSCGILWRTVSFKFPFICVHMYA